MKKWILNAVLAVVLFVGGLVGALGATGRLDHEGVANIPLLSALFPAPPETNADAKADGEHAGAGGHTADAGHSAGAGAHPAEGGAAPGAGHPADAASGGHQGPHGAQSPPQPLKRGRSIFEKEEPKADGGHGGGHGESGGGHGEAAAGHGEEKPAARQGGHADQPAAARTGTQHAAERDFDLVEQQLARERLHRYSPGGLFRFDGMPAGLTAAQLNDAWQRVQNRMRELEHREEALGLREKELQALADDVSRRQTDLGRQRAELEDLQVKLDERIERFQQQVKLVRTDEVAGLKKNAQTLANFEPSKAAGILQDTWRTEAGQDEVVKLLEYMDKDSANTILAAMPRELVREVMQRRMKIVREPAKPDGK